jgi:predicted nuclease with TOPRIM domain
MDDQQIRQRIQELAEQEQSLRETEATEGNSAEVRTKLKKIEVESDWYWDLLRQREAKRNAGLNPDEAQLRPAAEVEGYRQ